LVPFAAVFAAASAACALVVGLEDKQALEEPLVDGAAPDGPRPPDDAGEGGPVGGGNVVASGQAKPWGIAVDATHVYWTNEGDGTVLRMDRAGSPPTFVARGQPEPHQLIVDANQVIWHNANLLNRNGDDAGAELLEIAFLAKADVGGIALPDKIETRRGASEIRRIAAAASADNQLWTTTRDQVRRYRRNADNNDRTMQNNLGGKEPTAVAADDTYVYWFLQTPHELWRAGKLAEQAGAGIAADPELLTTLTANPEIADMVVDQGHLYTVTKGGLVLKMDTADAGAPQTLATGFPFPHAIVHDDNNVYFTHGNDDAEGEGQVVMVPKAGGAPRVLAKGLGKLRGIATLAAGDGTRNVYWAGYGDGTIRSVTVK
jgi:hypothetical protein